MLDRDALRDVAAPNSVAKVKGTLIGQVILVDVEFVKKRAVGYILESWFVETDDDPRESPPLFFPSHLRN